MQKEELKERLSAIKANNCKLPQDIKPFDLASVMLDFLGDTDGELRDNLIYTILANWILEDTFTHEELRIILRTCLDENHLFYGLGEIGDSVFKRTFSALTVPLVIYMHRKEIFLKREEIEAALDKVAEYIGSERDLRGYVEGKGWAHGTAHASDALDELALCEELGYNHLWKILNKIHDKVIINFYTFVDEEDERMVTAVKSVLMRKIISRQEVIKWVESFEVMPDTGDYHTDSIARINVKNFLRSLYFRLFDDPEFKDIVNAAKAVLDRISKF